ncbi:hypothetical protein [Thioalkalivibrio sp. ALE16]|uniref:hypothetical protein n=1 Tax=Thioalkalivibrio sp. ALE16 TaxID=1158172 RepID=UPI0003658916|nr:hypothetical protein [Thioalkalivibrio sp. ALE16]
MSNNYETTTVLQDIPKRLLNPLDQKILEGMGVGIEEQPNGSYYLFLEDGDSNFWVIEPDELDVIRKLIDENYPDLESAPGWMARVGEVLQGYPETLEQGDRWPEIDFPEIGIDWRDVLQSILSKPENTGPDRLDCIEAKAAYWCDKTRRNEFGGHVTRITRESIDVIGIDHVLEFMRKGGSIGFDGQLESAPATETETEAPTVLNEPQAGDSLYEGIVTFDSTCSATVRVYAPDGDAAAARMTSPEFLTGAQFDIDDGGYDGYYLGDPDAIECIRSSDDAA